MSTTPFLKHPHWNSLIIFDVFSCVVFVLCRVLVRLATHPSSLCAVAQQTFYRSVAASLASYPPNTRRRSHHSSKPHEQPHQTEVFVSVQSRGSHHSLHKSLPTIGPFSPSFAAFVTTSRRSHQSLNSDQTSKRLHRQGTRIRGVHGVAAAPIFSHTFLHACTQTTIFANPRALLAARVVITSRRVPVTLHVTPGFRPNHDDLLSRRYRHVKHHCISLRAIPSIDAPGTYHTASIPASSANQCRQPSTSPARCNETQHTKRHRIPIAYASHPASNHRRPCRPVPDVPALLSLS